MNDEEIVDGYFKLFEDRVVKLHKNYFDEEPTDDDMYYHNGTRLSKSSIDWGYDDMGLEVVLFNDSLEMRIHKDYSYIWEFTYKVEDMLRLGDFMVFRGKAGFTDTTYDTVISKLEEYGF